MNMNRWQLTEQGTYVLGFLWLCKTEKQHDADENVAIQFAISLITRSDYNSIKQSQMTLSSRNPKSGAVLQHRENETPESSGQQASIEKKE